LRSASQGSSAHPEGASEIPAKAQAFDMVLEDKSRRRQAEHGARKGHRHSQICRPRKVRDITEARGQAKPEQPKPEIEPGEEAELIRIRVKKTSEAAELLSEALGADGVALLVEAFSEEERPRDLLSALRRRL
jgi:hypothetical protein